MSQINVAKLDHDGILWGLEPKALELLAAGDLVFCARSLLEPRARPAGETTAIEVDAAPVDLVEEFDPPLVELPEGAIWVAEDCDLAPGAYRWNAKERRFDPLPVAQRKVAAEAPSGERALLDLIEHLAKREDLPPATKAWAEWMRKTIDEQGRK